MDLVYFFLYLFHIKNQFFRNHLYLPVQPINYQTSSFTITILPQNFADSSPIYFYLQKIYNLAHQPITEKLAKELKSKTIYLNRYGQTAEEEAEGWFLEMYPYIPECNKNKRCTAVILRFTPEQQLQKDHEKVFDYIYQKQFGQSKAVFHLEEAIHIDGDKLIIASIDESKALREFYRNLDDNKNTFLTIICPLGFLWGLVLVFFGKKVMNFVGIITAFICTVFIVNFWSYPAKLSEYYSSEKDEDFYWNLALVLGSGFLAGFFARKSEKIVVCFYYGLIGFVLGGVLLIISSFIMQLGTGRLLLMWMVSMEGYILYKLTKYILKHYLQASVLITSLLGGTFVSLSILLYFGNSPFHCGLRITWEGIMIDGIGTRGKSLLIYLALFLAWYGRRRQLDRELIRRIPQEKNVNKRAEGFRNHWRNYEPSGVENNRETHMGE